MGGYDTGSLGDYGGVDWAYDVRDGAHRGVHMAGVTLASMVFADATEISGASFLVGAFTYSYTILNLTPGPPFNRAAGQWEQMAEMLDTKRSDLASEVQQVRGGGEDLWQGPGAEAFVNYVESDLLPAIDALASSARTLGQTMDQLGTACNVSLIKFYAITIAGTILAYSANALNAVPFVGPALAAAAKWFIVWGWIPIMLHDIYNLVQDFIMQRELFTAHHEAWDELAAKFGSEGDDFDASALDVRRQEIDSILSDTGGWGKA